MQYLNSHKYSNHFLHFICKFFGFHLQSYNCGSMGKKKADLLSVIQITSVQDVWNAIFAAITQGILCAGASVYANQIYKQLFDKKGEK